MTALEYFIVPQSMWPVGILYAAAVRDQLDGIADRIMTHVKADFKEPPRQMNFSSKNAQTGSPEIKQYYICKPLEVYGREAPCQERCCCRDSAGPNMYQYIAQQNFRCAIPAPLQERLIARANACFLELKFNPTVQQLGGHPWAFKVSVPFLTL